MSRWLGRSVYLRHTGAISSALGAFWLAVAPLGAVYKERFRVNKSVGIEFLKEAVKLGWRELSFLSIYLRAWALVTKTSKHKDWNQRSFLPLLPAETRVKLTELIGTNKHKMSRWAFELSIWDKPRDSCTFWVYLSTGKVIIWSSNIWGKIMDIADRNHWLLALPLGNRGSFP